MKHFIVLSLFSIILFIFVLLNKSNVNNNKLNIYNWSDYIADGVIEKFEEETGILVTYDVYDSNEVLETKILAGSSGYDLVVPTSDFLARGREVGAYQDLDLKSLKNYNFLDKTLTEKANHLIGDKESGIIYMWGTTGVAYNEKMVLERLGPDATLNSLSLIFNKDVVSKLQDCGVTLLDAPTEVFPAVLMYLGLQPTTQDAELFKKAHEHLMKIRPFIKYIHSSQPIVDMANGEICVALMWSGDAFIAADRASEANNGHNINYVIPKEGTNLWFDMMAIPKDAKNVKNAHKFIDFMLNPKIAAENTNSVWYANANAEASKYIDPEILNHRGIYPSKSSRENMYILPVYSSKSDKIVNRLWTNFSLGN